MDNLDYRIARESDYSSIKNLMLIALESDPTAFSVSFDEYNSKSDSWWRDYVGPFVYQDSHQMVLVYDEDQLVGFSGLVFDNRERKSHVGSVVWFFVDETYRGKGIGKELLQHVIQLAKDHEIEKLSLMVNENQSIALQIYKKYGFEEAGKLKKEIKIDGKHYDIFILERFLD